jgi:single-stranded-DNA-specific exonuclease
VLKGKHLKLQLGRGNRQYDAIWFNHAETLGASAMVAYRLDNNTFNGVTRVQMVIEHAQ